MRLTKVTLSNYRSFWSDDDTLPSVDVDLSPGVNYFVGPNNVGKSNLLRAVALALDPKGAAYVRATDRPSGRDSDTSIALHFQAADVPSSTTKALLKAVERYEKTFAVPKEQCTADRGVIRFYIGHTIFGERSERLQFSGTEDIRKNLGIHRRTLKQFHDSIRYVDIKSGEDLQSLLQRGFKEILASAMGAELVSEMKHANGAREAYIQALGQVLRPVAKHVQDRIRRYVRGINEVDLVANVPPVEDAIADAQIYVEDAVRTALENKGTGVRGAMLLLLLSFIAESAKNAVVFGIEEPEAFLHPNAHRELGAGLERFTQRHDVTLLVTSHSPFIFRADGPVPRSEVFVVRKDEQGRSTASRDATLAARTELLGSQALSLLLEKAEEVPDRARLILVVEGETDARYLQLAAHHLGAPIEDIHLVYYKRGAAETMRGASFAAVQAITLGARHAPARIVAALFDTDEDGKAGRDLLANRFGWKKKKPEQRLFVLDYELWVPGYGVPVEAEDLFETATLDAFLAEPTNAAFRVGSRLRQKSGKWHYDLSPPGKIELVKWLEQHGTAAIFEPWRPAIDHLRKLIADAAPKASKPV